MLLQSILIISLHPLAGTIEYEAQIKHDNEMKRLEAELRGK